MAMDRCLQKAYKNYWTTISASVPPRHLNSNILDGNTPTGQLMFLPIQVHMNPGSTTMPEALAKALPENYISILIVNNHQFSRGSVHIRSFLIENKPACYPNFLSHQLDLEVLARQTQYVKRVVQTGPFASLLKPESRIPAHAVDLSDVNNTKKLSKKDCYTCFHPSGTCAMMPAEMGGVVDDRLKVHGTSNLRVIDANVFPLEPSGNIQAPIYAVAGKAADLIKEDHRGRPARDGNRYD